MERQDHQEQTPEYTLIEVQRKEAYTEEERGNKEEEKRSGSKSVIKESIQNAQGGESTLKDVFQAVQICNTTLITLSSQIQDLREEVTIIRYYMENVWRTHNCCGGQN